MTGSRWEQKACVVMTGSRWEQKACVGCGYVRRVFVRGWDRPKKYGGPSWNRYCGVCELQRRADHHNNMYVIFSRRVQAMRAKRAQAAIKKGGK